ncbi:SDR family oxidoreductase [Enemella sp. A6]|uniref:SDR family oxidoreductase n=1 Tax=Enemella sp. A6 TaxID=3440152 RepID=UPI003EB848B7
MARQVVVTGAASGIGKAVTELLRSQGHTVIGVDLKGVEVNADLSTPEGRKQAVDEVLKLSDGKIDAAILAAGISRPEPLTVSVNYFGVVEFAEGIHEALRASAEPRLVVLASSVAGTQEPDPAIVEACLAHDEEAACQAGAKAAEEGRGQTNYNSSKNAVAQWTRRTALAWAPDGIAVNAMAPGVILSPMGQAIAQDPRLTEVLDRVQPMPLLGHAEPEDLAPVIAFFASAENTMCTGQIIYTDRGVEVTLRPQDRV